MDSACLPMLQHGGHCDKEVQFGLPLCKRSSYLLPGAAQCSALTARSGAALPDCTGPLNSSSLLTVTLNPVTLSLFRSESGQRWLICSGGRCCTMLHHVSTVAITVGSHTDKGQAR